MKCLYVTSDRIGTEHNTGGGTVTHYELQALKSIADVDVINPIADSNPFQTDVMAMIEYSTKKKKYDLAHFYAGCYTSLIKNLKQDGTTITYTAAAHDIKISQEEHAKLGYAYDYPHITDPELWKRYLGGYLNADLVITPSTHSKNVMTDFGCKDAKFIPHGHNSANIVKPIPKKFKVGYVGAIGPDKGLIYLMQAWKQLRYMDTHLTLAGRQSEMLLPMVRQYGGGGINLAGFIDNIDDFYNSCSVYVQPSTSEGFGIEILEAMSFGRPVISTTNNAGPDLITDGVDGRVIEPRNANALAEAIDYYKKNPELVKEHGQKAYKKSKQFTWDKVTKIYSEVWHELCSSV